MISIFALFAVAAIVTSYLVGNGVWIPLWHLPFGYVGTFIEIFFSQYIVYCLYALLVKPRFSPLRHLPGPKGGDIFMGQWYKILGTPSGAIQSEWIKTIPNDGLIRYLGLFNKERLLLTSPKALSEVLTTKSYDFVKPYEITIVLERLLGNGVLLAEGNEHKFQRKNLMPAFSFRHIKNLYPTFWAKAVESALAINEDIDNTAGAPPSKAAIDAGVSPDIKLASNEAIISVGSWASRATLDIVGVAGIGRDFNSIADPNGALHQAYVRGTRPSRQTAALQILNLILPTAIIRNLPIKRNTEMDAAVKVIRDTCHVLISEKQERLASGEEADKDILSVAIESGAFTDEQLVDQLMTFLAAGHETTSTAMLWAIYLLSINPDMQIRLREEVRASLPSPDSDASITAADIDHLPYLNAVCSEVLRHHAPIPITLRKAAVDTTIIGEAVPKGTTIYLAPWATNRDPKLWGEDAEEFRPDRWLNDASGGAESNYAFMSFVHGPRSCIGEKFARGEFACLLATWVGRFEFELAISAQRDERNIMIRGGATSKPMKGLWMKTKRVDGW